MNFAGRADELCAHIAEFFDDLAAATERVTDDYALAHALSASNKVRRAVALNYSLACDPVVAKMEPTTEPIVTEDGLVEISRSRPRTEWEHDDLKRIVAERVVDLYTDMDTGEQTAPTRDVVLKALEMPGSSPWRVKQLATLGLDADDYCKAGVPKKSASFRG